MNHLQLQLVGEDPQDPDPSPRASDTATPPSMRCRHPRTAKAPAVER
jgi:hypothetical protein